VASELLGDRTRPSQQLKKIKEFKKKEHYVFLKMFKCAYVNMKKVAMVKLNGYKNV
jgi:hypothetical protein